MTPLRRLACILILATLFGCAAFGTAMADFHIEGSARLDEPGASGSGPTVALLEVPTASNRISPFPDLRYQGEQLTADLLLDSVALHGQFSNRSASTLRLRFDQATMSSNLHPQEVPLLSWGGVVNGKLLDRPSKHALVPAVPLTLQAGASGYLTLAPSYAGLYPSRRLFGVRFADKQAALLEDGVGNSLRLRIPVEQEGKILNLVVELRARRTQVRTAYF